MTWTTPVGGIADGRVPGMSPPEAHGVVETAGRITATVLLRSRMVLATLVVTRWHHPADYPRWASQDPARATGVDRCGIPSPTPGRQNLEEGLHRRWVAESLQYLHRGLHECRDPPLDRVYGPRPLTRCRDRRHQLVACPTS